MHIACRGFCGSYLSTLQCLLEYGADVNSRDNVRLTYASTYVEKKHMRIYIYFSCVYVLTVGIRTCEMLPVCMRAYIYMYVYVCLSEFTNTTSCSNECE